MKVRDINRHNKKQRAPSSVVWEYEPHERQRIAHVANERFKLYGGAVGGGKSVWLCAESILQLLKYPGNRGFLCRNTLVDLRLSTLVTFEKICPKELIKKHIAEDHVIVLRNDSELTYGGLGGTEDLDRIKSREFGFFAMDEATECGEEHFLLLCSRLRWRLPDGTYPKYYGLLASNPEPGWVKERFVDHKLKDHIFIPALPRDNPNLPKDYDAKLRDIFPEEAAKRYLDGSWDVFEGQIYKEFSKASHVYSDDIFERRDSSFFDSFRVIDHGYRNPTCCLWISIDFDGVMYVWDEHYARGLTIKEHAKIIQEKHGDNFTTICDPSMFSRTMQGYRGVWSPADEYRDNGIVLLRPFGDEGKMSELSGINLVKQRFKAGSLKVHERCENTIAEIIKYRWKNVGALKHTQAGDSLEVPIDRDNHAVDNIRYACMWRPPNASLPKPPENINSLHYAIMKHKNMLNGGFYAGWSNN